MAKHFMILTNTYTMLKNCICLQICELGNLSVHWALRCLRPAGSKGKEYKNRFNVLVNVNMID